MTSLSDLLAFLSLKYLAVIVLVAVFFAGLMEFAFGMEGKARGFAINASAFTVTIFAFVFLLYAGWNTMFNQRYGSGDLFLSFVVVFGVFVALVMIVQTSTGPKLFHPVVPVLGVIVTVIASGLIAILLPLAGKFLA